MVFNWYFPLFLRFDDRFYAVPTYHTCFKGRFEQAINVTRLNVPGAVDRRSVAKGLVLSPLSCDCGKPPVLLHHRGTYRGVNSYLLARSTELRIVISHPSWFAISFISLSLKLRTIPIPLFLTFPYSPTILVPFAAQNHLGPNFLHLTVHADAHCR